MRKGKSCEAINDRSKDAKSFWLRGQFGVILMRNQSAAKKLKENGRRTDEKESELNHEINTVLSLLEEELVSRLD